MERILFSRGYNIVDTPNDADLVIVNSCGVKKQTEDRVLSYIKHIDGKKVILTGCLPLINKKRIICETDLRAISGPSLGNRILDILEAVEKGSYVDLTMPNKLSPLIANSYNYRKLITEPIGISNGCLDNCSFCATKFARHILSSHPIEQIIKYIKLRSNEGVKEFYLTSPDTGAYGYDLKPRRTIIDLLRSIEGLEGDFKVRLGMINPRWVYKWLDELIELFGEARHLYRFLHIPVQSGSDKILKIMNRSHGTQEYVESVKRIRKEVDHRFNISTDIIVGHPGESDEDFEMTIHLIKDTQPDIVNISKFFPRPGTKSKGMKQIPTYITKNRSRELTRLSLDIMQERNKLWIGWSGKILVNEIGKNKCFVGRNYAFKPIVISEYIKLGVEKYCRVVEAHSTWLAAILLEDGLN
jgi:MiaB-like tRNA modifying enzyme